MTHLTGPPPPVRGASACPTLASLSSAGGGPVPASSSPAPAAATDTCEPSIDTPPRGRKGMTREQGFEALRPPLISMAYRSDGGGGVGTGSSVTGAENAARVLAATVSSLARVDVRVELREVNGHPGAIMRDRPGKVFSAWTLDIVDGAVQTIRSVNNPDTPRHLGPVVKLQAVAEERNRARRGTR